MKRFKYTPSKVIPVCNKCMAHQIINEEPICSCKERNEFGLHCHCHDYGLGMLMSAENAPSRVVSVIDQKILGSILTRRSTFVYPIDSLEEVPGDIEKILAPFEDLKTAYANKEPDTEEETQAIKSFWDACYAEYKPETWQEQVRLWVFKLLKWIKRA